MCPSVTQYHRRKSCPDDKSSRFHDGYCAEDGLFGFDTVHTGTLRHISEAPAASVFKVGVTATT
jgi:hypothetical protein